MEKIIKRFEVMMIVSFIMCFLDVIAGVVFIKCTDLITRLNVIILGSLIVLHGLFYLIRYIYDGLGNKFFAIDLIISVASLILGVFTIFNPFEALNVLGPLFGIWMIIYGIEKIYYGYRFMKGMEGSYPLTLFIGIIMVIMGILSMINPFSSFMLITRLVGIFLICSGLLEAMICNLFRQRSRHILTIFK